MKKKILFITVLFILIVSCFVMFGRLKLQKNESANVFLVHIDTKGPSVPVPVEIVQKFLEKDVIIYENQSLQTETVKIEPQILGESSIILKINGTSHVIVGYIDAATKAMAINISLVSIDKDVLAVKTEVTGDFETQSDTFNYAINE